MHWEIVRSTSRTPTVKFLKQIAGSALTARTRLRDVHDNVEDSFEVVEGRLDVKLDGTWRTYGPGERAAGPGHQTPCETATMSRSGSSIATAPQPTTRGSFAIWRRWRRPGGWAPDYHTTRAKRSTQRCYSGHTRPHPPQSRVQQFAFATLSGPGRMLGMSL